MPQFDTLFFQALILFLLSFLTYLYFNFNGFYLGWFNLEITV